jgi:hypothetical protein
VVFSFLELRLFDMPVFALSSIFSPGFELPPPFGFDLVYAGRDKLRTDEGTGK